MSESKGYWYRFTVLALLAYIAAVGTMAARNTTGSDWRFESTKWAIKHYCDDTAERAQDAVQRIEESASR